MRKGALAFLLATALLIALPAPLARAAGPWYLAGSFTQVLGCANSWDASCSDAELTQVGSGSEYAIEVVFTPDATTCTASGSDLLCEFKVTNADWSVSYPSSNASFTVPQSTVGDVAVTFFFNEDTHAVSSTFNPRVVGDFNSQLECGPGEARNWMDGTDPDDCAANVMHYQTSGPDAGRWVAWLGPIDGGQYAFEIYDNGVWIGQSPTDAGPEKDPITDGLVKGAVNVPGWTASDKEDSLFLLDDDGWAKFVYSVSNVADEDWYSVATYDSEDGASRGPVYTVAGDFQTQFGCDDAWDPTCVGPDWRAGDVGDSTVRLSDDDGDDTWAWGTSALQDDSNAPRPTGDTASSDYTNYTFKITDGLSWYRTWGTSWKPSSSDCADTDTNSSTCDQERTWRGTGSQNNYTFDKRADEYIEVVFDTRGEDEYTWPMTVNGYWADDDWVSGNKLADGVAAYTLTVDARNIPDKATGDSATDDWTLVEDWESTPIDNIASQLQATVTKATLIDGSTDVDVGTLQCEDGLCTADVTAEGIEGKLTISQFAYDSASGTYTAKVTSTVPAVYDISISVSGLESSPEAPVKLHTATLPFNAPTVTVKRLEGEDASALADGEEVQTVVVTATDENGHAYAGKSVVFDVTDLPDGFSLVAGGDCAIDDPPTTLTCATDAQGKATFAFTSTLPGSFEFPKPVLTQTGDGYSYTVPKQRVTGTPTIEFYYEYPPVQTAYRALLDYANTVAYANGSDQRVVTVKVVDAEGNAVVGQQVCLAGTPATITLQAACATTDGDGVATFTHTSTTVGAHTYLPADVSLTGVDAADVTVTGEGKVEFIAVPPAVVYSAVVSSPSAASPVDGGTQTVSVTVTGSDGSRPAGKLVCLVGAWPATAVPDPSLTIANGQLCALTNDNGVAVFPFKATAAFEYAFDSVTVADVDPGRISGQAKIAFYAPDNNTPDNTGGGTQETTPGVTTEGGTEPGTPEGGENYVNLPDENTGDTTDKDTGDDTDDDTDEASDDETSADTDEGGGSTVPAGGQVADANTAAPAVLAFGLIACLAALAARRPA
ncbi:MAG: Ig-like domain-containing protein [Propionibacteriaceae bacterium]|jgi:hypothetical protein|nr:Ig-like domain-containing protein [Propionibacteriaceae bacterium]